MPKIPLESAFFRIDYQETRLLWLNELSKPEVVSVVKQWSSPPRLSSPSCAAQDDYLLFWFFFMFWNYMHFWSDKMLSKIPVSSHGLSWSQGTSLEVAVHIVGLKKIRWEKPLWHLQLGSNIKTHSPVEMLETFCHLHISMYLSEYVTLCPMSIQQ